MRAKNFDDIEIGNKILMEIPGDRIALFVVSEIDQEDRSVLCKDSIFNFYPNEDDQYIVLS